MFWAPSASMWSELGLALNFTLCICTTLKTMQSESSRSLCFSWRKMLSKKKTIPTMCTLAPCTVPSPLLLYLFLSSFVFTSSSGLIFPRRFQDWLPPTSWVGCPAVNPVASSLLSATTVYLFIDLLERPSSQLKHVFLHLIL